MFCLQFDSAYLLVQNEFRSIFINSTLSKSIEDLTTEVQVELTKFQSLYKYSCLHVHEQYVALRASVCSWDYSSFQTQLGSNKLNDTTRY